MTTINQVSEPLFYQVKQAAELLNVKVGTIYSLIKKGKLAVASETKRNRLITAQSLRALVEKAESDKNKPK